MASRISTDLLADDVPTPCTLRLARVCVHRLCSPRSFQGEGGQCWWDLSPPPQGLGVLVLNVLRPPGLGASFWKPCGFLGTDFIYLILSQLVFSRDTWAKGPALYRFPKTLVSVKESQVRSTVQVIAEWAFFSPVLPLLSVSDTMDKKSWFWLSIIFIFLGNYYPIAKIGVCALFNVVLQDLIKGRNSKDYMPLCWWFVLSNGRFLGRGSYLYTGEPWALWCLIPIFIHLCLKNGKERFKTMLFKP